MMSIRQNTLEGLFGRSQIASICVGEELR
jgi:hypothetical protein